MHIPKNPQIKKSAGFALVIALSLMAFVLVLLLSMTTLIRVESQASFISIRQLEAKQSAYLGVMVALGELQKSVGPDTRVTATAELFDGPDNVYTGGLSPFEGQEPWVGVWRSSTVAQAGGRDYDPAQPNERSFVGWLVSAADANGVAQQLSSLDDVENVVANQTEPVVLALNGDETPRLIAGKVNISRAGNSTSSYAFAVQDEGVKADVGWHERSPDAVSSEVYQGMRLAAAPGPDYGALFSSDESGTFDAGAYPLSPFSRAAGQLAIFNIGSVNSSLLAIDAQDSGFLSGDDEIKWLRDQRQDFTAHSVGVLSDVRKGGLRRDLSLAFEMDGEADTTVAEQPTKFNQQVGEFVGGNDRMSAPKTARGMPVPARHLYRDLGSLPEVEQSPFSTDISPSGAYLRTRPVLRGPTWWALRDYANLYKHLREEAGEFVLDARAYYPNWSALSSTLSGGRRFDMGNLMGHGSSNRFGPWDQEDGVRFSDFNYLYMPSRASYAPVILGGACALSVLVQNERPDPNNIGVTIGDLSLGIDPFFYLWNPYNRRLDVDRLGIVLHNGFPGTITFWKNYGGPDQKLIGPSSMRDYLIANETEDQSELKNAKELTYLVQDLQLEPGEVVIVSPRSGSTGSRLHDEAFTDINIDNQTGVITKWIPEIVNPAVSNREQRIRGRIETVVTAATAASGIEVDRIDYLFTQNLDSGGFTKELYAPGSFALTLSLPDSDSDKADLAFDDSFRILKQGNHLQTIGGFDVTYDRFSSRYPSREYFVPELTPHGSSPSFTPVGSISAGSAQQKQFFGFFSYLAKPSSSAAPRSKPVEMLAQFNPAAPATSNESQRSSTLNHSLKSISEPNGIDQFLLDAEIGLPGDGKGYWGRSYDSYGMTSVPFKSIPSRPLLSLVEFRDANLGHKTGEPFRPVGESFASIFTKPESPYGPVPGVAGWGAITASDVSWLVNDALFDRYFLSGLAPDFQIGPSGYQANGTLRSTLDQFYGADFQSANASPLFRPYIPEGSTGAEIVDELAADDGYKRFAAYALIDGAFNVNSTSVRAWEALLRSNRQLAVNYAEGGSDSGSGTPFPSYVAPSSPSAVGREVHWSGLARLDDRQVRELAEAIVDQVKLRGPFMSLSDFVNRRVGSPVDSRTHLTGAIQAAIEIANLNSGMRAAAGGVPPEYTGAFSNFFENEVTNNIDAGRRTTTGIAGELTQADILLPLAPRLSARSDTFTIRAYGEVRSPTTGDVSRAYCEATVQRLPEYVNGSADDPWDEAEVTPFAPTGNSSLDAINAAFGRRFTVVDIRWLNSNEI